MRSNWLEWAVLAVSLLAVVGIVGFLVVDAVVDEGRPPEPVITLRRDESHAGEQGWSLPATVGNRGDVAAEAVVVRATATVDGSDEERELTIDYLPSGTDVEVVFVFSAEPEDEVTVETIGFRLP